MTTLKLSATNGGHRPAQSAKAAQTVQPLLFGNLFDKPVAVKFTNERLTDSSPYFG